MMMLFSAALFRSAKPPSMVSQMIVVSAFLSMSVAISANDAFVTVKSPRTVQAFVLLIEICPSASPSARSILISA